MAIYISITKVSENETVAVYDFGPTEDRLGRLEVDKASGEVRIISEVPGDEEKQAYSPRAGRKVFVHWREGEYPEVTCWAS